MHLHDIQKHVQQRTFQIVTAHGNWPCKKGCADCCRHLAAEPQVSEAEWRVIVRAMEMLPVDIAQDARDRIQKSAGRLRPVVCPLLDEATEACLIYEARPIACRSYGFYAERDKILGCSRIEDLAGEAPEVIWGNHAALETQVSELGETAPLSSWLEKESREVNESSAASTPGSSPG